ncbi:uncharacterized protein LOC126661636 [Mercurialis annua]|uniref:uncharacterized protein LOC126661636 n=1 Tax=Mercurialis annua TaxID=3986 RepID=UPI00215F64BF|nr:uncharacterized protein LOC126661636 [Mercurialis annua]
MERKKIIDFGLAWRIGNWLSVDAKNDHWINSANLMKPSGLPNIPNGCTVSFFIDQQNKSWDRDKLVQAFSPHKVESYYQACKLANMNTASSSGVGDSNRLWKKIWKCPVPPKVRHFLWRIYHQTLPCNANMVKKMIRVSSNCTRCGTRKETAIHALKQCEEVGGLWLLSPLCLRADNLHCFAN